MSGIGEFIIGESAIGVPYTAPTGNFPPSGPTSLTAALPSYLYEQYFDDEDIQVSRGVFNATVQENYMDWYTDTPLPVYTNPNISGPLLDWVAQGRYGLTRPALPSGMNQNIGPYNTAMFNQILYNQFVQIGNQNYYATDDDTFKRILTWHVYKGDGKNFSIPWLKRRVMRFLYGANGTDPPVDNTYPISVTFGSGGVVNINISVSERIVLGGAFFNAFAFNTLPYGNATTEYEPSPQIPEALVFKAAVEAGALELPFQFTWIVNV